VVRPAGGTVVIMDEAEEESAPASPTPWYDRLPSTARLDWPRAQPGMPEGCEHPHDLDENLNGTRGILRQQCAVHTNGWFAKGAYEVMLEQLFKQKLPEII